MIKVILEVWVLIGIYHDGSEEVIGVYESNAEASSALMQSRKGDLRRFMLETKHGPFNVGFDLKHFIKDHESQTT